MSTTIKTPGTLISWNGSDIGEAKSFTYSAGSTPEVNISSFADAISDMTRPGRRNGGTFTIAVNFNPDNTVHAALDADRKTGVERTMIATMPEGTTDTITVTAVCMNFSLAGDATTSETIHTGTLTIKVTDAVPEES